MKLFGALTTLVGFLAAAISAAPTASSNPGYVYYDRK
jgi:hypothetical protein